MTETMIDLPGVIAKSDDADFLRELIQDAAQRLMEIEVSAVCGAGHGERSPERENQRNGYRPRQWDTRAGTIGLNIPKLRKGSYFPTFVWIDLLRRAGVRISMDGKGRYLDNIFIERLWRTLKYECVYLHAWETGSEARAGLRNWFDFYNRKRPHSAHGGLPPAVVYWQRNPLTQPDQQEPRVA